MKFAKELDEQAIVEWKGNYFDYKQAKKKLKAVAKAVRSVPPSIRPTLTPGDSLRDAPVSTLLRRRKDSSTSFLGSGLFPRLAHVRSKSESVKRSDVADYVQKTVPMDERSPLQPTGKDVQRPNQPKRMASYGSIIGSPPNTPPPLRHQNTDAPSLVLPGPAVGDVEDEQDDLSVSPKTSTNDLRRYEPSVPSEAHLDHPPSAPTTQLAHTGNAYQIGPPTDLPIGPGRVPTSRLRDLFPKRTNSMPDGGRPLAKRMFSITGNNLRRPRDDQDIALEAYRELDFRKAEFFLYLDKELLKIGGFYKSKEDEARERLNVIREQLHIMREYRLAEINALEHRHQAGHQASNSSTGSPAPNGVPDHGTGEKHRLSTRQILKQPLRKSVTTATEAIDKLRPGHVGKTSKAMGGLGTPDTVAMHWDPSGEQRDYERRAAQEVPYRIAKRKMKMALSEFYRSLELVKSYALLNHTAFRKINKKYDKTVNTKVKLEYLDEKVNKAHFVTSDEVDHIMSSIEDLYARYFERGNRKVAISKLRTKVAKMGDYTGSVARTCALLGAGSVFAIQGLVKGAELLFHADATKRLYTAYLLQLYAGYFLIIFLAFLFCGCAGFFCDLKVNYQFIFELDRREALYWLQLAEIPAWLYFLLGVVLWLNFDIQAGGKSMFIYWIVVLNGLAVVAFFLPAPVFYHRARKWATYTLFRLLCSGFYGVEFRDFFTGDMMCSLTYAFGNIELFFCLFAGNWGTPSVCNSSHSRLLGFLSCLPGIWRAIQCIRRYRDTHTFFPHMVNCGKYMFTIGQYTTLSLYRIDQSWKMKALFVAVATINSCYCSVWDIAMDWSLGDPRAKHRFLRPILAYRKHIWMYYAAMVIDPILRFNWIFYPIYTSDTQHSSLVSFLIALSEILRRGMWTLFRIENEHCTNVQFKKASRDLPLPYKLSEHSSTDRLITSAEDVAEEETDGDAAKGGQVAGTALSPPSARDFADFQPKPGVMSSLDTASKHESKGDGPELVAASKSSKYKSSGEPSNKGSPQKPAPSTKATSAESSKSWTSKLVPRPSPGSAASTLFKTSPELERQASSPMLNTLHRVGTVMRAAHAMDYQRKKPAAVVGEPDSDDDDDDDSDRD